MVSGVVVASIAHGVGDFYTSMVAYGVPDDERNVAVLAFADLSRATGQTSSALPVLLDLVQHDPISRTRIAAANALAALQDPSAIPVLSRVKRDDTQALVQIAAADAIITLKAAQASTASKQNSGM